MRARRWMLVAVVSVSSAFALAAPGDDGMWNVRMQMLAGALTSMLPDLVSDERFSAPGAQKRILDGTTLLAETSRDLERHASQRANDPIISILGGALGRNARDARAAYAGGNPRYARSLLLGIAQECVACHTRADVGPQNPPLPLRPDTSGLTPVDRALVLTAVRQFDPALMAYRAAISDVTLATAQPGTWRRALVNALAIAVRTKGDARAAQTLLDEILFNPPASAVTRDELTAWKRAILEWRAERESPTSEDGLHTQAVMLLARAEADDAAGRGTPGLVNTLRATSSLHTQLLLAPKGPLAPEAMLMLGQAYARLRELDDGALSPTYFAACIRARPGSAVAAECFDGYSAATREAFTGSAGYNLPDDVKMELDALGRLARKKP